MFFFTLILLTAECNGGELLAYLLGNPGFNGSFNSESGSSFLGVSSAFSGGINYQGVVTPFDSMTDGTDSETVSSAVGFTRCQCLEVELCVNGSNRNVPTTRIVTRPPSGMVCPPGNVYCCVDLAKIGCGMPSIIPGVHPKEGQAQFGQYPWSAIILTQENTYVGGGVLIDPHHILTVAHRVAHYGNGARLKVRLGDWDLSNEDEPFEYLEVNVSKIMNHPKFEAVTLKNDISLITLATSVFTFTQYFPQINTICLPEPNMIFTGMRCKVSGWGKDQFDGQYQEIIKEVEVPILSSMDCQTKLRNTRLGNTFTLDTQSFICAGGEPYKDACTGDGGNALACLKDGKFFAAGITAGGIECGHKDVPGLYVNLVNYIPWIKASIFTEAQGIDPRRSRT